VPLVSLCCTKQHSLACRRRLQLVVFSGTSAITLFSRNVHAPRTYILSYGYESPRPVPRSTKIVALKAVRFASAMSTTSARRGHQEAILNRTHPSHPCSSSGARYTAVVGAVCTRVPSAITQRSEHSCQRPGKVPEAYRGGPEDCDSHG